MLAIWLAAAITYTLHAKDIFQPPKPPADSEWTAQAVPQRKALEFQTSEGARLRGWSYKADRTDAPYVLFFYGSNEDLVHESNRLAWLRDSFHVNAICFDYPGYGFSSGHVDGAAIRSAALQEFDYVRTNIAPKTAPVISYGWSIGSGVAIHLAAQRHVDGLILQAPPASAEEMAKWSSHHDVPWYAHGVVKIAIDPEVRDVYQGATEIQAVQSPLLVIQGERDDVVPIAQGREVFAASPAAKKEFVEVPGARHNDLHFTQPPASLAVERFLQQYTTAESVVLQSRPLSSE